MKPSQANTNPPAFSGEINILEGETFLVSNDIGDVTAPGAFGLFHRDTRFLNQLFCQLNGHSLEKLTSRQSSYFEASFYLCNDNDSVAEQKTVSVIRRHLIERSLLWQRFTLENHNNSAIPFEFSMHFAADFADLFEVKSNSIRRREFVNSPAADGSEISFTYSREEFFRETKIAFSQPSKLSPDAASFTGEIAPKGKWELLVRVDMFCHENERTATNITSGFHSAESELKKSLHKWKTRLPELQTDDTHLKRCFDKACMDLASLQIEPHQTSGAKPILAAGLPWFMTLFGRDSLITSYQTVILGTDLAERTLKALANEQAESSDDFRDMKPGKIMHELRYGELTAFGELPYSPYYGSIDSTILFLILISEVYRWTGKFELLVELHTSILKAVKWIEKYGDCDGDGYVEYETRSSKGLRNQGWKDSGDGIQFFDGTLAEPPIALSEVQGYLFDAYNRSSELLTLLAENELAKKLAEKAQQLKEKFNSEFWSDSNQYFVLGLDKNKRQIDSVCSNAGHLLWSGIVDKNKAQSVATTLMSDSLFNGWGVRTLSTKCAGYSPIGYHTGTVWPHDNAVIAAGLMKYGFVRESHRIIKSLLEAGESFQYRFPEAFAGYDRDGVTFPARYPTSCSPQAWASGTPLLFLRTVLGLEPDLKQEKLTIRPNLPAGTSNLTLSGIPAFGRRFTVQIRGDESEVRTDDDQ